MFTVYFSYLFTDSEIQFTRIQRFSLHGFRDSFYAESEIQLTRIPYKLRWIILFDIRPYPEGDNPERAYYNFRRATTRRERILISRGQQPGESGL